MTPALEQDIDEILGAGKDLAIEATEIFQRRGWNRATESNPFQDLRSGGRLRFLRRPKESDSLEKLRGWRLIMAASGMCDAGRVRRHLKRLLWRKDATVLLSGFQAMGTLGRILQDGAGRVSIEGEQIQVRARIRALDVYSAHADATGLTNWVKARGPVAGQVFLLHGEPAAREGLRTRLVAAGVTTDRIALPGMDEGYVLTATKAEASGETVHRIAAQAVSGPDWHNARAGLLIELDQALQAAGDDASREQLLANFRKALAVAKTPVPAS